MASRSRNIPGHYHAWQSMSEWELEAKRAEVRRMLRDEDHVVADIAEATGYSSRQVERIARKMGLTAKITPFTEEEKERVRELGKQGLSLNEISWRLRGNGRRVNRIAKILDAAGIPRRHKGEIWPGDKRFDHVCKGNVKRGSR